MKNLAVLLLIILGVGWIFLKRQEVVDRIQRMSGPTERSEAAARRVGTLIEAEMARLGMKIGDPIFIRTFKETSELELWVQPKGSETFIFYKNYPIARWTGKLGPKRRAGDDQTPEGFYWVAPRHLNPASRHHLSINIGFPNQFDRNRRWSGSLIMIHGGAETSGGFAMTDAGIEEIYTLAQASLQAGQEFFRVHCFPFRMTDGRMNRALTELEKTAEGKELLEFWANLKIGYDYFEIVGKPPNTSLKNDKYVFE